MYKGFKIEFDHELECYYAVEDDCIAVFSAHSRKKVKEWIDGYKNKVRWALDAYCNC